MFQRIAPAGTLSPPTEGDSAPPMSPVDALSLGDSAAPCEPATTASQPTAHDQHTASASPRQPTGNVPLLSPPEDCGKDQGATAESPHPMSDVPLHAPTDAGRSSAARAESWRFGDNPYLQLARKRRRERDAAAAKARLARPRQPPTLDSFVKVEPLELLSDAAGFAVSGQGPSPREGSIPPVVATTALKADSASARV